jgi:hypothetical protein
MAHVEADDDKLAGDVEGGGLNRWTRRLRGWGVEARGALARLPVHTSRER